MMQVLSSILPFPAQLCDEHGTPRKGSKAAWTDKIEKCYTSQTCQSMPVTHFFPVVWVPEVVILDAMFLIQCNPLRQTMTIKDYALLLLNHFAAQHYQAGVPEVHFLFDVPRTQHFNPKEYEQKRRDFASQVSHDHQQFEPSTKVPKSWRRVLECWQCKRSIIEAIGLSYIQQARFIIGPDKRRILAGCFTNEENYTPIIISGSDELPQPDLQYK